MLTFIPAFVFFSEILHLCTFVLLWPISPSFESFFKNFTKLPIIYSLQNSLKRHWSLGKNPTLRWNACYTMLSFAHNILSTLDLSLKVFSVFTENHRFIILKKLKALFLFHSHFLIKFSNSVRKLGMRI